MQQNRVELNKFPKPLDVRYLIVYTEHTINGEVHGMNVDFSTLSDTELCQNIDLSEAFKELELRYLWLVRLKACELLKDNQSEKDDFIQEGLLGLYFAGKTFKQKKGASFKTYASVCIHNRMVNELIKSKRNSYLNVPLSLGETEYSVESPEAEVELREDFKAVLNRIHISLSEFEQKILALYLSGYKRSEIPSVYGISLKAYDNAIQRVRKKLKSH